MAQESNQINFHFWFIFPLRFSPRLRSASANVTDSLLHWPLCSWFCLQLDSERAVPGIHTLCVCITQPYRKGLRTRLPTSKLSLTNSGISSFGLISLLTNLFTRFYTLIATCATNMIKMWAALHLYVSLIPRPSVQCTHYTILRVWEWDYSKTYVVDI